MQHEREDSGRKTRKKENDGATERALFCFGERVCLSQKVLLKSRIEFTKKVLEEVVMGPRQKEPESMLGEESCVESLAKDDHVKVRDHQEDVDENDPASKREWKE